MSIGKDSQELINKDVIQLKKKEKTSKRASQSFALVSESEDNASEASFNFEIFRNLKFSNDRLDDDSDRCCPEDERSSQASDYYRKPSNVDISPPPESSETTFSRQQEFLKHFYKIKLTGDQANCMTIVLQDAVYEMLIINNCNRELLEEMGVNARKQEKNDGDKDDTSQVGSISLKLAKMESDRIYVTDILSKVYLDMKINKSFPTLLVHLSDESSKSYQMLSRELHYKELKMNWRKLEAKLARDIEGNKKRLIQCDREIYKLMDDIDDSTWNSDIKIRYVESWQNAQMEQHSLAIEKTEWGALGSIRNIEDLTLKENRIHTEIINYFKASMEDYTEQIESWMERYDSELDKLDMDIRLMKEKRDIQMDETNALQALLDEHKREMDEWQAVLDERARKKALEELMLFSAIKIQAWWRGTLARKLLKKLLKKKRRGKKGKKKK